MPRAGLGCHATPVGRGGGSKHLGMSRVCKAMGWAAFASGEMSGKALAIWAEGGERRASSEGSTGGQGRAGERVGKLHSTEKDARGMIWPTLKAKCCDAVSRQNWHVTHVQGIAPSVVPDL